MEPGQKKHLEERFKAREWYGRSQYGLRASIKGFALTGSELPGWKIQRTERDESAKPRVTHSLWSRNEAATEILSVDFWECSSIRAADDQVLDVLANMQSADIERRTGTNAPGDVAFGLNDTMVLFARANLVVLLRNAGPKVVMVGAIATRVDAVLIQRLKTIRK